MISTTAITRSLVICFVMLLVSTTPPPAQAQTSGDAIASTRVGAILRSGPGAAYPSLGSVPRNTSLQLIGRTARGAWFQVRTPEGREGWVGASQIRILKMNPLSLPVITPDRPDSSSGSQAKPMPANAHSPAGPLAGVNVEKLRAVFRLGRQFGNRARAFSKMGDSSVRDQPFLYGFGLGKYTLGPYQYLQDTIDYFSSPARDGYPNSFVNPSLASVPAFNAAAAWDASWTAWTDPNKLCQPEEGPLDCEIRVVRPSLILIKLGLEDMFVLTPDEYRAFMTRIVEHCMARGVIPVLNTFASNPHEPKYPHAAENAEKQNEVVREIAAAQQIPLIELREPVMKLPDLGLNAEGIHVSDWGGDPYNFNGDEKRWGITLVNLLTLQMLDRLRVEVLTQ